MDISSDKLAKSHTRRPKKETFMKETESLQIAAQNNDTKTNYTKSIIVNVQQNNKCRLCGDRDEMINHMISECSKLRQRTRCDWVGKVIY